MKISAAEIWEGVVLTLKIVGVIALVALSAKGYKVIMEFISSKADNGASLSMGGSTSTLEEDGSTLIETDKKTNKKKYKDKMEDHLSSLLSIKEKYSL